MTEKAFWAFLKMAFAIKGMVNQVSGCVDGDNRSVNENGRYIGGHSVLFNGYDRLPEDKIEEMGTLLFGPSASTQAKEAILMMLAHYPRKIALDILRKYNKNPDKELMYYARTALWECRTWNE